MSLSLLAHAALAGAMLAVGLSDGASAQTTHFDIEITQSVDVYAPIQRMGRVNTMRMTITLSGKNNVRVQRHRASQNARFSDHAMGENSLGSDATTPVAGTWRVVRSNLIEGTQNFPNHVRVASLSVNGSACSYTHDDRLKAGKSVYLFPLIGRKKVMGEFGKPRILSSNCVARTE